MKKLILLVVIFTTALMQRSSAQVTETPDMLTSYYSLKDALVNGDGVVANSKAIELSKAIKSAESSMIGTTERSDLLKSTAMISDTKDIKVQRQHFAELSDRFISLAKSAKLSTNSIYVQYCPMKKSSWLSSEKSVKNPYYGSAMLTCGKVTDTIN